MDLREHIRDVPGFPKPGIVFKDITPLVAHGPALRWTVDRFCERYKGAVDIVLGIESRGFIVGSAVAYALGVGMALVRKPGKLPADTYGAGGHNSISALAPDPATPATKASTRSRLCAIEPFIFQLPAIMIARSFELISVYPVLMPGRLRCITARGERSCW